MNTTAGVVGELRNVMRTKKTEAEVLPVVAHTTFLLAMHATEVVVRSLQVGHIPYVRPYPL